MDKSYVLIDNDKLIRMSWELSAKKENVNLSTFSCVDDFLKKSEEFIHDSIIYIDHELDNNLFGTIEAKKIFDLGFYDIYLATGHSPSEINLPSYFKGICGKRPPFNITNS